jgi:general secretion pathway protein E
VLRLLDKQAGRLDLTALGMESQTEKMIDELIFKPHGILLVTGPTGSGKTTSLYAALERLNDNTRNIMTVEDPIEYYIDGIGQTQVNTKVEMTFARGLRAILRQDPDVVMVGEIRDLETAQIAVQSALTGHLVLSTVHTNDAASTVNRLLDMGVEDYLLTSTVIGILAQRLVRTLCPACKTSYTALPEVVAELGLHKFAPPGDITLYHAKGCKECAQTGFIGRVSILEMLPMSDPLRTHIMRHANSAELRIEAIKEGMVTMYEDGMRKALNGVTTFEEVLRVTREN